MPLNMEKDSMDLPDFALGQVVTPVRKTEFQPLFEGQRKLEMVSDIVIETPIVEQPASDTNTGRSEDSAETLPEVEQENEPEQISLEEHQAIIDDLKKRSEDELNKLRETHENEVQCHLKALESGLFDDISAQLETKIAQSLSPLVETCVSRNTLDTLAKEIRSIAGKEAVNSLHLSGPPSLISAIKEILSDSQLTIEVEETDSVELVACLNDKLISTRLKEWSHKIETAIF